VADQAAPRHDEVHEIETILGPRTFSRRRDDCYQHFLAGAAVGVDRRQRMSTFDEITKEKQRLGEALARVDAQCEKLTSQRTPADHSAIRPFKATEPTGVPYHTESMHLVAAMLGRVFIRRKRQDRRAATILAFSAPRRLGF
jgi:hypothetical protein